MRMTFAPLSPLDGRYREAVAPLSTYLSEEGLNHARLKVETAWLIFLTENELLPDVPRLNEDEKDYVRAIAENYDTAARARLSTIEAQTVHDVKAVEYFIKERIAAAPTHLGPDTVLPNVSELVHFGCTSEDINNLAYALTIRDAVCSVWLPQANALVRDLRELAEANASIPMLARTHGQPASPTTLGKEMAVFAHRLARQLQRIAQTTYLGKFNGATGTYGAHLAAAPDTDWIGASHAFVAELGLSWNPLTTQIESHDWQAELFADLVRFGRIVHNLATDCWTYISLGYFRQVRGQGTVGSSTMPHKVNPIRFENAEANLEISAAILDGLAASLVTSRLQRDLTDSTTQRNIGVGLGHSLLALVNIRRGLAGLDVDPQAMSHDLDENWEVLAEPIQSAMRAAAAAGVPGMDNPYERLKELTRGQRVDGAVLRSFVAGLGLPAAAAERLSCLTPATYVGLAPSLVTFLED